MLKYIVDAHPIRKTTLNLAYMAGVVRLVALRFNFLIEASLYGLKVLLVVCRRSIYAAPPAFIFRQAEKCLRRVTKMRRRVQS